MTALRGKADRVPRPELDGNEETFNIEITYDTPELHGKMTAARQVVIYRD